MPRSRTETMLLRAYIADVDFDRGRGRAVLCGLAQQVADDLFEAGRVCVDERGFGRDQTHAAPAIVEIRLQLRQRRAEFVLARAVDYFQKSLQRHRPVGDKQQTFEMAKQFISIHGRKTSIVSYDIICRVGGRA